MIELQTLSSLPPSFWILSVVGVYLTGIAKSGFAGGTGVVAVPLMATVIDPRVAAGLLLPLLLFMDAFNVRHYRGQQAQPLLTTLLIGSLLGVAAGFFLFERFSATQVKLAVGIIGVTFACLNLSRQQTQRVTHRPAAAFSIGAVAGFTSFIAHAGGPPLNGYLLRLGLGKITFLATASLFLALQNVVKLPAYAVVGSFNRDVALFSVVLLPAAWLGVRSGLSLKSRISDARYGLVMNLLLLVVSSYLLIDSGWTMISS